MSDVTIEDAASSATGLPVVPHQNWFAVALSTELPIGGVIGVPYADGRLALFRRSDGSVVALSSRCAHMGADLAAGDVVDDELRCMFHHFCYGADGRCTKVPSNDRIPSNARVHSFPADESVGLVWVFNGEAPPSPPPGIAEYDPAALAVRARRTHLFEVDPWVIIANSFDFMHLRYDKIFHTVIFFSALLLAILFVSITLMDSTQYQADVAWQKDNLAPSPY